MDQNEVLHDVFITVKQYGIHHPVNFHSWRAETTIIPYNCVSCNHMVFPLFSSARCIKCNIVMHRNCCQRFGIMCSEINSIRINPSSNYLLPSIMTGLSSVSSTKKVVKRSNNIITMTVCDSPHWTNNLSIIWSKLSHSEQYYGDGHVLMKMNLSLNFEHALSLLINEMIAVDQRSFLSFTVVSLLQLYVLENTANPSTRSSTINLNDGAADIVKLEQAIVSSRQCLNVVIQAVILWIGEWFRPDTASIGSTINIAQKGSFSRKSIDAAIEQSHEISSVVTNAHSQSNSNPTLYCTVISTAIHQQDTAWQQLVNTVEKTILTWNDQIVYRTVMQIHYQLTRTNDSELRIIINRSGPTYGTSSVSTNVSTAVSPVAGQPGPFTSTAPKHLTEKSVNSKFCHLNENFMKILNVFETISTVAVTPLDKLDIMVEVLQLIAADGTTPPNHHVIVGSLADVKPPQPMDTDQMLQKLIEIVKYSYLSGNGINWWAEVEFMSRMMFGGVLHLSCDISSINSISKPKGVPASGTGTKQQLAEAQQERIALESKNAQKQLIIATVIGLRQDWLLGMQGYALVSLQQALNSLMYSNG